AERLRLARFTIPPDRSGPLRYRTGLARGFFARWARRERGTLVERAVFRADTVSELTPLNDIALQRPVTASEQSAEPEPAVAIVAAEPIRTYAAPSWAGIGIFILLLLAGLAY